MAARLARMGQWKYQTVVSGNAWNGRVNYVDNSDELLAPIGWKPSRVFVCSMGDLFHDDVPDTTLDAVFATMALSPRSTFMLLTKRPLRMRDYILSRWAMDDSDRVERAPQWYQHVTWLLDQGETLLGRRWDRAHAAAEGLDLAQPLPNVWLGVTAEDQEHAEARIPVLLTTPAARRFVSVEPMLGPVNLHDYLSTTWLPVGEAHCTDPAAGRVPPLDWVICGGESGPGARPMHPDWARALRDQCRRAGVPFFFKQWGEWGPLEDHIETGRRTAPVCLVKPDGATVRPYCQLDAPGHQMARVGKKAAGRLLDGITWDQRPEMRPC